MKFIVFHLQFINSLEGLGMFFSSTTFVRRLRRYAATEFIPFDTLLTVNFPLYQFLKQSFFEKPIFFQKKTMNVLRNLTISVAFYDKFAVVW